MSHFTRICGLSEIARKFDGILLDQFGVLHDGENLYPGALEVLRELHHLDIPVVIMTNSGRRASGNLARLLRMGVPRAHVVDVVSSGEIAARMLESRRAFLIGRDGEDYGHDKTEFVSDPDRAEFILILGSNAPKTSMDDYRQLLSGLTLPAICCNPDKQILTRVGLLHGPGAIADLYAELGGRVTWIGKPYPDIYWQAARLIGNPKRVLCIGDSAEHDVAGGRAAGYHTLLVMTGVSEGLDAQTIHPQPDYLMDGLIW